MTNSGFQASRFPVAAWEYSVNISLVKQKRKIQNKNDCQESRTEAQPNKIESDFFDPEEGPPVSVSVISVAHLVEYAMTATVTVLQQCLVQG